MTIALVNTAPTTGSGSVSSLAVAYPSGLSANDIVVCSVSTAVPSATVTTPTGWTAIANASGLTANGNDHRLSRFWRRIDLSEGATQTFNFSTGSFTQAQMYAFSGCITTGDPTEAASFNPSGASQGTTITATGLTITSATALVFIGTTFNNAAPSTAPTGMTAGINSDNQTMSYQVGGTLTGNRTITISNDYWSGALISLLPAAGGGGGGAADVFTLTTAMSMTGCGH